MRKISIFGSTGSIGVNTVALLDDTHDVEVVTGARNITLLAEQAKALNASLAVTACDAEYDNLKAALKGTEIEVAAGPTALVEAATRKVDWGMVAIVGSAGLAPTLELAKQAGTLALANKESMVCAGELVNATCAASGCKLIPVDSEHSAVYQSIQGNNASEISRIILTASGGPFREWTLDQMADATLKQALAHPNFEMGQRITIDSATMFNKALEVIEAYQLFGLTSDQIEVIIHPQQIIHSMVEYADASIIAQLGAPDMRGAIGYALHWPNRKPLPVDRLNFAALRQINFEAPDETRFPALRLAKEVLDIGGLAGTVFNAAKEVALDKFIAGEVGFLDMSALIEYVLGELRSESSAQNSLDGLTGVMNMDELARSIGHNWRPH